MSNKWNASIPMVVLCSLVACALLFGCSKSPEEVARLKNMATVKRIALVGFYGGWLPGKSATSPPELLVKAMYEGFQKKSSENCNVVELIPIELVISNGTYSSMAQKNLPTGVATPVNGLTILKEGQDVVLLTSALNVDALLTVKVDFFVTQEQNASSYVLHALPQSTLQIPSARDIWGREGKPFSGPGSSMKLPLGLFENSALFLSLGVKWAAFSGPSDEDRVALNKIAVESGYDMASRMGASLFERLSTDIRDARKN